MLQLVSNISAARRWKDDKYAPLTVADWGLWVTSVTSVILEIDTLGHYTAAIKLTL